MTTHQRDLCRAINRHGQILSQFQDAKRMGRFTAPTWHAALVVAAQQARRWLWLAQAGEERERTPYGVLHPMRADRSAFANVENGSAPVCAKHSASALATVEKCPKCGGDDYSLHKYHAPGVVAPDYTCAWMQCFDCGFKTEPV